MKVLIEMRPEQYDLLVAECDITSPEYSVLKNGIVARDYPSGNGQRLITILCDEGEAMQLLNVAQHRYPDAAPSIERAIRQAPRPDNP
jgi:hypothetical protein